MFKRFSRVNLFWLVCFGFLPAAGCTPKHAHEPVREIISQRMTDQQAAWNDGDLEGFMAAYWQSDSLTFIGKNGLKTGWQATLEGYQRGYPDRAAMGQLQFTNLSIDSLDRATYTVIGKWELFRAADTLRGHYSLIWQKRNGQWVIISDHSS
jgi:hypothetical protein